MVQLRTAGQHDAQGGGHLSEAQQLEGVGVAVDLPATPRTSFFSGLRGRLLILTAAFVLFAVLMIYPVLAGTYRNNWLEQRGQAAQIAALAVGANPDGRVSDELSQELLTGAQVVSVAALGEDTRELIVAPSIRITGDLVTVDLRQEQGLAAIVGAFGNMFAPDGRFLRILLTPSMTPDKEMEVIVPEQGLKAGLLNFSRTLLLISLIVSVVAGGLVYFAIYRLVVKPMQGLTRSIVDFAQAPEGANIAPIPGESDEMKRAHSALQSMQRTVSASFRQRKRLADLGEAVAKINHDLRNSLAAAQIVSEGLTESEDPRVKRAAPRLERAIERAIGLAESTLRYGRAEPPEPKLQKVALAPVIEEAATEGLAGRPGVAWSLEAPRDIKAVADPEHVHRIIANLVRNAARAIADQPGRKQPGCIKARVRSDNACVRIEVSDNGPGLPASMANRLFRPFAGSGSRDGSGLGLAIARELARGMKGELELTSTSGDGAVFTLRVPAAD